MGGFGFESGFGPLLVGHNSIKNLLLGPQLFRDSDLRFRKIEMDSDLSGFRFEVSGFGSEFGFEISKSAHH